MIRESAKEKGSSTPLNLLTCPVFKSTVAQKAATHLSVASSFFFFYCFLSASSCKELLWASFKGGVYVFWGCLFGASGEALVFV